jgi:hypothetical protein
VTRKTRVALLYSISSDLWQPWGYIHMLERRATYQRSCTSSTWSTW